MGTPACWILIDASYFGLYAVSFGLFEGLFVVGIPLAAIPGLLAGREASPR